MSYYSGNVGGNFDFGGRTFNAGVKADIFLDSTNILLVPQGKVLDGILARRSPCLGLSQG